MTNLNIKRKVVVLIPYYTPNYEMQKPLKRSHNIKPPQLSVF